MGNTNHLPRKGVTFYTAINSVGGGEVWEELNLSSLPTDFVAGDRIKISFKKLGRVYYQPSSWTASIGSNNLTYTDLDDLTLINELIIPSQSSNPGITINSLASSAFVFINTINFVALPGGWNSGSILELMSFIFNGSGCYMTTVNINRGNASNYFYKMWRLKK